MKTPIKELIERLERIKDKMPQTLISEQSYCSGLNRCIAEAESMLEKEKEVIIETSKNSYIAGYLDNQAKVDDSMNFPEEYYNETFNTINK